MEQNGVLLIVCGPSGVGKTSLCTALLERFDRLQFSVSYTTREPREDETDGVDYEFIGQDRFDEMRESDQFAEWAKVHGNYYGTSFDVIRTAWEQDNDLLFDIDYQGARQLKESFPKSTGVLIVPPDMQTLEGRLRDRGSESDEAFRQRLNNAKMELSQYHLFDFIVENDEFDRAADVLSSVYVASRHRRDLQEHQVDRLLQSSENRPSE